MKTNNAAEKMLRNANIDVSLAHSRYGTPQPHVEIRYPRGTHYRVVRAALYALAGKLETATPAGDNWVVEVDAFGDESGRVYLELVKADEAETKRGLELLRKVVGATNRGRGAAKRSCPRLVAREKRFMIRGLGARRRGRNERALFAYGSNLNEAQMRERCPGAVRGPRALLRGYALTFGGFSYRWGGAVASIIRAQGAEVHGLLYTIDAEDIAALDRCEGHPFAYERVERIVIDEESRRRRMHLYLQPEEGFEP